jgi:hypothetical protein
VLASHGRCRHGDDSGGPGKRWHGAATRVGGGAALQHSARMLARVGGGAARRLQHDGDAAWRSGLPRTTAARCSGGKDDGGGTTTL